MATVNPTTRRRQTQKGSERPAALDLLRLVEEAIDPERGRYEKLMRDAKRGVVRAVLLLGVILYVLDEDPPDIEQDLKIVDGWGNLLIAATTLRMGGRRDVFPVDPATLLEIKGKPAGWEWGMSLEDADEFLERHSLGFKCSDMLAYWRGDPSPYTAPVAVGEVKTLVGAEAVNQRQTARLQMLRDLGGDCTRKKGKWSTSGITDLVKQLKANGQKPNDEKTVRKDLIAAAEQEKNPYVIGLGGR